MGSAVAICFFCILLQKQLNQLNIMTIRLMGLLGALEMLLISFIAAIIYVASLYGNFFYG